MTWPSDWIDPTQQFDNHESDGNAAAKTIFQLGFSTLYTYHITICTVYKYPCAVFVNLSSTRTYIRKHRDRSMGDHEEARPSKKARASDVGSGGLAAFALRLAKKLAEGDDTGCKNIAFSPLSLYTALGLVVAGAQGKTFGRAPCPTRRLVAR